MAVRQYIGARYVPLYVGDWDATRNYEPLSIVTDANGNSFTSLKDVPAGTPLNNRTYWIQTSSFSGAVDQLQRRMNTAESDISTAKIDIDALETRTDRIEENVRIAQSDIDALETISDSLKASVNRNILVLSDSYGGMTTDAGDNFVDVANQIIKKVNPVVNVSLLSESSLSFFNTDEKYNFIKLLKNYKGDRAAVTEIIVVGGANDVGSNRTRNGIIVGIYNFYNYMKSNYPNATLILFPCGTCFQSGFFPADRNRMIDAYSSGANYVGASCVPNADKILYDPKLLLSDKLHPNPGGVSAIGKYLASFIDAGFIDVSHVLTASADYDTTTGAWYVAIKTVIHNEMSYIMTSAASGTTMILGNFSTGRPVDPTTKTFGGLVNIGNLTGDAIENGSTNREYLIPIPADITYMDDTREIGLMYLSIYDGSVKIDAFCPSGSKSGNKVVKSIRTAAQFVMTNY